LVFTIEREETLASSAHYVINDLPRICRAVWKHEVERIVWQRKYLNPHLRFSAQLCEIVIWSFLPHCFSIHSVQNCPSFHFTSKLWRLDQEMGFKM